MAKEYFYFGSTPCNEDCVQVGQDDYQVKGYAECKSYVGLLYRFLESKGYDRNKLPEGFRIHVKSEQHDLGSYYEVVSSFPDNLELGYELSYLIDQEGPTNWDDVAKKELGL